MSAPEPSSARRPRLLYVSDLAYEAKGRRYCDEDIYLSAALGSDFDVAVCPPAAAGALLDAFDLVVIRNSGPVIHYMAQYEALRNDVLTRSIPVSPDLAGKADQRGKQYLLDLYATGYPVIPTIDNAASIDQLPQAAQYIAKPKFGADSVGMSVVERAELAALSFNSLLVQPRIDFSYEVSFYFVDREPHYALSTPDPTRRWDLAIYAATTTDWAFAQQFVDWNSIERGIQRVDACRTQTGELLLVEIEDLNPYLSLDLLDPGTRDRFVESFNHSLLARAKNSL